MDRAVDDPIGWARPRARLVATAFGAGVVVGLVATVALLSILDARGARTKTFAAGALILGFGVLGWSGSILGGRGIENAQRYMETGTDWSQDDSRRAMARIGSFGGGVMLSVGLLDALVG